jgi:3-methylcrotonyl-CoA carboxylase alpha subunit
MRRILEIDGEQIPVWLAATARTHVLHMDEREIPCALEESAGRGACTLVLDGTRIPMRIAVGEGATFIHVNGRTYEIGRIDPAETLGNTASASQDQMIAPMPGVVVSVSVAPGDAVADGQPLLVIESMKLETTITAPRDGIVAEVPFATGAGFGGKDVLLRLEPHEETA